MTKKTFTISALATMLVLSMAAMAVAGPGYGRGGCGGFGGPNAGYSQLTPEKQAEAQAVYDKYELKLTELRDAIWTKHAVLQAMINDGDANESKIGKLTAEMSSLRGQMRDTRVAMSNELRDITGFDSVRGRGYACDGPGQGRGYGYGHGSRW